MSWRFITIIIEFEIQIIRKAVVWFSGEAIFKDLLIISHDLISKVSSRLVVLLEWIVCSYLSNQMNKK